MGRALRRWFVFAGIWAAISLVVAFYWAHFTHSFDICIPEWGCSEEDPPLDREFALHLVETFLKLWIPVAVAIALGLVLFALASAVAADFEAGRWRHLEERRPTE